MHNAAFRALGLDYVYVAHRVRPSDLAKAVDAVRVLGYVGLNVTVPHKERILPLLDSVTPVARSIGAVNAVVRRGRRLVGDNTDGGGFRLALERLGFRPKGKSVLVLGAGGSARAVVWALVDAGVGRLRVVNRTVARAAALRRMVPPARRSVVDVGPLSQAVDPAIVAGADLIVNCTSLGLDGRTVPPLAVDATPKRCLVYDLVYGAHETPLVRLAKRHGRRAADGRGMLLEQAGLGFRLWTGRRPPLDVMRKALVRTEH